MSEIKKLIEKLCPEGVDYKKFYEVCSYIRGVTYNKKNEINDNSDGISVLRANNITLNTNKLNFTDVKVVSFEVKVKETQWLKKDDILICAGSGSKEHIGKVAYIDKNINYTFGGFMGVIRSKNGEVNSRYLFHILTSNLFKSYLVKATGAISSTINNINNETWSNFEIPVPPIEVQSKIVEILDNFTELEAELEAVLEAELEARRKQYEYYRNQLLTFDKVGGARFVNMSEIGRFYGGLSGKNKNDFGIGKAKYITYMNVYSNIAVNLSIAEGVNVADDEKQNAIQFGDIIFTGSSETPEECGMSSVVTENMEEPIYLNSFCFGFRIDDLSIFNVHFLKHLFRSYSLRSQIIKTASGVTRFNVSKKKMEKILIPIPPLAEQERIVSILDRFEALTTDLQSGLPAEIEARRKQYEYYREQLLKFKRL